jgi:drug/metabolite transporter (DMT)-like permease
MKDSHTTIYFSAALASALLFGAATPTSKILLEGIQPQSLAGLLYLGAALGVLPIVIRNGAFRWPWHAGYRTLLLLTGAILLGGILAPVLLLIALRSAQAGSVSLWLNLELAATVVLGHFVFREHMTLRGWIAAAGTFIAALILAGGKGSDGMLPIVLVGLGCICWGLDNHFTALIDGISPAQITLWKGVVAGTINSVIGYVASGGPGQPLAVFIGLLIGVFSYGLSLTLYVTAAQGMGAARSQMVFSTAPFFREGARP